MVRRIRWQILIAVVSSIMVLMLMSYLAISIAAVQRPAEGGDYVEALLGAPGQLNPLLSDALVDQSAADIRALIFEGLLSNSPDGLPLPVLAQSWEASADGETYTFTLRPNVRWHDGKPLTAKDVLFTIHAIQSPAYSGDMSLAAIWRTVDVEAISDLQIRCRLSTVYAPFLKYTSFPILPAHIFENSPADQWATLPFNQLPIGTGPYRLTELNSNHALLQVNAEYYGTKPFIQSIELRFFDSQEAALNALISGEVRGLHFLSTNEARSFKTPDTIVRRSAALDRMTMLSFNLRRAPMNETAFRRALATGLDRTSVLASALDGQGTLVDSPLLPQNWASAPDISWYEPSQERAAALLDELGFTMQASGTRAREGQALVLNLITDTAPDRVAAANEIARQWATLGVNVTVEQLSSQDLQARLAAHDFDLALHAWQRIGPDPDVYELWHSDTAEDGANYAGLQDGEIDTLLLSARQTPDQEVRAAAYSAFQRRWIELAPSIPLYQAQLVYLMSSDVNGVDLPLSNSPEVASTLIYGREGRFHNLQSWFLQSSREITNLR